MNFKDYINESFDSSYNFKYEGKGDYGVDIYSIDLKDETKLYRVFIERVEEDLHIGFERKINGKWSISEITNDLKSKEVFGLFGSIIKLIEVERRTNKTNSIFITTDNFRKSQTYFGILSVISKKIEAKVIRDKSGITLYFNELEKLNKIKFKYKK